MRVRYTLPGLLPAPAPETTAGAPAGPSFQNRLRRLSVAIPVPWSQTLRLDRPPAGGGFIGPPPRPATLETRDAASERVRWRSLLDRHSRLFEDPAALGAAMGAAGSREMASVQRMLALLQRFRELEDAVIARQIAEGQF